MVKIKKVDEYLNKLDPIVERKAVFFKKHIREMKKKFPEKKQFYRQLEKNIDYRIKEIIQKENVK